MVVGGQSPSALIINYWTFLFVPSYPITPSAPEKKILDQPLMSNGELHQGCNTGAQRRDPLLDMQLYTGGAEQVETGLECGGEVVNKARGRGLSTTCTLPYNLMLAICTQFCCMTNKLNYICPVSKFILND